MIATPRHEATLWTICEKSESALVPDILVNFQQQPSSASCQTVYDANKSSYPASVSILPIPTSDTLNENLGLAAILSRFPEVQPLVSSENHIHCKERRYIELCVNVGSFINEFYGNFHLPSVPTATNIL